MTGFVTKKISRAKTLGQVLKAARSKRELSIEDAESGTKICQRYLTALEDGRFETLPAEAYNIGFVRTYATFLKLDPEKIVQLYREERSHYRLQPTDRPLAFSPQRAREWKFLITPKTFAALGTIILFGSLAAYIGLQLNKFAQPPTLELLSGATEFTSTKDTVKIVGKTSDGATLTMNAEPISVGTEGTFTQEVQLSPGINEFTLSAKNRVQKESKLVVKVLFNPDLAKAK